MNVASRTKFQIENLIFSVRKFFEVCTSQCVVHVKSSIFFFLNNNLTAVLISSKGVKINKNDIKLEIFLVIIAFYFLLVVRL